MKTPKTIVVQSSKRSLNRCLTEVLGWCLLLSAILLSTPVFASKKVALVVGNNLYENVPGLNKAVNDAITISGVLQQIGFDVIQAHDLNRRATNQKLHEFISRVGPGDVAMFYYAGHGVEIKGQNYLLPVDVPSAVPGQEGFVMAESISLESVLSRLREKQARLNIVVLDACRNNPFKNENQRGIGSTRGLAVVSPPKGTFILYSADAGEAALDALSENDNNPNSVFTRILAPMILKQNVHLARLARDVRREVKELASTVQHDQTPAYYDAMLGDYYFSSGQAWPEGDQHGVQKSVTHSTNDQSILLELAYWNSVENSESTAFLESYIQQYPQGKFVFLAKSKIKILQEKRLTERAQQDTVIAKSSPMEEKPQAVDQHKTCEAHFKANRLTTGSGGNAYDCYREILDVAPGDALALAGVERIVDKYAEWTRKYISQESTTKAQSSLIKLQTIKPYYPELSQLKSMRHNTESSVLASMNEQPLTSQEKKYLKRGIELHEQYKWIEAYNFLEPLVKKNNLQAKTRVANLLRRKLVREDQLGNRKYIDWEKLYEETAPRIIPAGGLSDPWLMYYLSRAYSLGKGVSRDKEKSFKFGLESANLGYPLSQAAVGYYFEYGYGIEKNYSKAIDWYRKSVNSGNPTAYSSLGDMFYFGKGLMVNKSQAVDLYKKGAELGDPKAQYDLGRAYMDGKGIGENIVMGLKWLKKAADYGYAKAQTKLGYLYGKGKGVTKDYEKAMYWYQKAAQSGNTDAYNNIGYLYRAGRGVEKDYSEALKWFRRAEEKGNKYAYYNLGVMFRDGHGVERDKKRAFEKFKKAADKNHMESQYQIGLAYNLGSGVAKDPDEAQIWYARAAKLGHKSAKASLKPKP